MSLKQHCAGAISATNAAAAAVSKRAVDGAGEGIVAALQRVVLSNSNERPRCAQLAAVNEP